MCSSDSYYKRVNLQNIMPVLFGSLVIAQYLKLNDPYKVALLYGLPSSVLFDYGIQEYQNNQSNNKKTN